MIRRNVESEVRAAMADTPVVMLNGARQTGKTTLVKAIAQNTGAQYLTLDDAATLALIAGDPSGFVRSLTGPIVMDEVQKIPELFPAVKLAVDSERQPGRFLLTGSANVMTLPRLSESLVGRMQVIPLFPFSAGELAGNRESFLNRLFSNSFGGITAPPTPDNVAERLARGGYPEANLRQVPDRRAAWFAAYITTILQRDVRDLAQVDALHALPNLLKLVAARTSGLLNVADLGRDAGLPYTTLTRYLALFETVFLVHRLPAWSRNISKRLVKTPKICLVDTGLACHLIGADTHRLAGDRSLMGRLLETFVVGELRKQVSWSSLQAALYHFRTMAGSEVDIVLEKPEGSVAAVEVKAGATVDASDFNSLKRLRDELGSQFAAGAVLYLGDKVLPFGDRLWLVPLQVLWGE